jgi:hypothetical protein
MDMLLGMDAGVVYVDTRYPGLKSIFSSMKDRP